MAKEITINCEDEHVEKALVTFVKSYKPQIVQFIQGVLQRDGIESDPEVAVYESDESVDISAFKINPSKGMVITSTDGKPSLESYDEVEEDEKYLEQSATGNWNVMIKTDDEKVDAVIGHFKTFKEGIDNFESDAVKAAIERRSLELQEIESQTAKLEVVKDADVVNEEEENGKD